jgi:hypothetical protein
LPNVASYVQSGHGTVPSVSARRRGNTRGASVVQSPVQALIRPQRLGRVGLSSSRFKPRMAYFN